MSVLALSYFPFHCWDLHPCEQVGGYTNRQGWEIRKDVPRMPSPAQTDLKGKIIVLFGGARTIHLFARCVCVRGIIVYRLLICLGWNGLGLKTLFGLLEKVWVWYHYTWLFLTNWRAFGTESVNHLWCSSPSLTQPDSVSVPVFKYTRYFFFSEFSLILKKITFLLSCLHI